MSYSGQLDTLILNNDKLVEMGLEVSYKTIYCSVDTVFGGKFEVVQDSNCYKRSQCAFDIRNRDI